jgi:hypothetical protein
MAMPLCPKGNNKELQEMEEIQISFGPEEIFRPKGDRIFRPMIEGGTLNR